MVRLEENDEPEETPAEEQPPQVSEPAAPPVQQAVEKVTQAAAKPQAPQSNFFILC